MTPTKEQITDALERIMQAVGNRCDCPTRDDSRTDNQQLDQCMWCEAREALEVDEKARLMQ